MAPNLLAQIDRSRKLMVEIFELGNQKNFEEMDVALKEFHKIYSTSDHYEIIESYVKTVSNAIVDFSYVHDEKRFLHQISILEEIYNSKKGVLLAEVYSNCLSGVIVSYSNRGKIAETNKFLRKLEAVYEEFHGLQFVVEHYAIAVYNLFAAEGKNENLAAIESLLDMLLDLNNKYPTYMFNSVVVVSIGSCVTAFGIANKLERLTQLQNDCRKIYGQQSRTTGPPDVLQQFSGTGRQYQYDIGYINTVYNASKYYRIHGNLEEMEASLDRLLHFFKKPSVLFTHTPEAGEPLGVAIRNACLFYAENDKFEKLEDTIKTLEKLFLTYRNPKFHFDTELKTVVKLALDYFDKIGVPKKVKMYSKKLSKYSKIRVVRDVYPLRATTRYQCKSCKENWGTEITNYEFNNIKDIFIFGGSDKCPYCENTDLEMLYVE